MRERIYYYPEFKSAFVLLGILLCIVAIVLTNHAEFWIMFFPLFSMGILLVLSLKGIVIDYQKKELIKYTDLVLFKIKSIISLKYAEVVTIHLEKDNSSGGIYNLGTRGRIRPSSSVISFEMYVLGSGMPKTFLCEFGTHAEARSLAEKLSNHLSIKIEDAIQDGIKMYKNNPWKRRR